MSNTVELNQKVVQYEETINALQKQLQAYKQVSDELLSANVNLKTNVLLLQEMVQKLTKEKLDKENVSKNSVVTDHCVESENAPQEEIAA